MIEAPDNSFKPLTLDDNSFRTSTTGAPPVVAPNDQGAFAQGAPSPDAFTLPTYSKSEQLQVNPAQYTWNPGDEGFGQGQVQKYGFDTGMVPVAEMKLPFGALAARGDSLAKREAANLEAQQKVKEKFDPYGGIGKAADPFQPAFGKYGMGVLNKLAADITEAYGGDEQEAWKRISTPGTQENQLWLQKSREISDVGTANQYEFGKYADLLAEIQIGKQSVSPETLKALKQFLAAQDEKGVPVAGTDPGEFRSMRRDLEGMISMDQYMKDFMDKLPSQVQEVAQSLSEMGRAKSIGADRYAIEQEITKQFGPALEQYAKDYSAMSGGRVSYEQALEKFRSVFNDARESVIKDWSPQADGGGGSGTTTQAPAMASGWGRQPSQRATPGAPYSPDATFEFVSAPLEKMGDRMIPPTPIKLHKNGNPRGALVMVTGFEKDNNGAWHVLGEEVTTKEVNEFNVWRQSMGEGSVTADQLTNPDVVSQYNTWKNSSTTSTGAVYDELLSANKAQIQGKFGNSDPYVLGGITTKIAQYNKKHGVNMTTADFGSLTPEQQDAIVNGNY